MQLISRKQEIARVLRSEEPHEPELIKNLLPQFPKFVGKEMTFVDARDPHAGKITFSGVQFTEVLQAFKIYAESKVNLTEQIVSCAQKAIGFYK